MVKQRRPIRCGQHSEQLSAEGSVTGATGGQETGSEPTGSPLRFIGVVIYWNQQIAGTILRVLLFLVGHHGPARGERIGQAAQLFKSRRPMTRLEFYDEGIFEYN